MDTKPVTSISVSHNVALVVVDKLPSNSKLISDILTSIAENKINVDMISQTPPYRGSINLSFSISDQQLATAIQTLNAYKKQVPGLRVEIDSGNTKVSVYGEEMKNIPGVAASIYTLLAVNGVEIKLITTSEVDISYLINDRDVDKTLEAIKKEFDIK